LWGGGKDCSVRSEREEMDGCSWEGRPGLGTAGRFIRESSGCASCSGLSTSQRKKPRTCTRTYTHTHALGTYRPHTAVPQTPISSPSGLGGWGSGRQDTSNTTDLRSPNLRPRIPCSDAPLRGIGFPCCRIFPRRRTHASPETSRDAYAANACGHCTEVCKSSVSPGSRVSL
jgi:hypothetical protein